MAEGPSTVIDGKRIQLRFFTGKVLSSNKQKETVVSSHTYGTQNNPQVSVSSHTVDHHEFFLMDDKGVESSFKTRNLDFPCREGNTVSVVWAIPEGAGEGPFLQVRNHNTNEQNTIDPTRIAYLFDKPNMLKWGMGAGALIVLSIIQLWFIGIIALFAPFFYFRWKSRKHAKELLASDAMRSLEAQLANVRPALAQAS